MLVLTGLRASWSQSHAGASTSFLTGTPRGGRTETEILASTSMDQLLAAEFGKSTQVASLELSLDTPQPCRRVHQRPQLCLHPHDLVANADYAPADGEQSAFSVRTAVRRQRLHRGEARMARMRQSKSMLDSVMEQLASLKRELGVRDKTKIEDFTEAVRDIERRIQKAEEQRDVELPLVAQPRGVPGTFEEHLALMLDLQLLAFQSDLTRVTTFMLGREQNSNVYPQIDVNEPHHPLSHHGGDKQKIALMSKVNTYHAKLISEYFAKLRATPDGDGSLMDHMTIMYGCGISDSTVHSPVSLPVLVFGGGAGRLHGGRHLKYSEDTPLANLLVTLMDKLDIRLERLGNSNGKLGIDTQAIETLAGM